MIPYKVRLRHLGAATLSLLLLSAALVLPSSAQVIGADTRPICREVGNIAIMFRPGTTEAHISKVLARVRAHQNGAEYQLGSRWSSTARNANTGASGNPVALGYSFVPDGTAVPDEGLNAGTSALNSRMNTLFSNNTALWKSKFAQVFQRWDDLTGLSYVLDNDDGAVFPNTGGSVGVRGDCRISMIPFNDNNVLAYNYFPNTGDMVMNQNLNWASSGNDYRFMRNILMHEHGHGLGLGHVDPTNGTKLMEAFLNTNFDGPQNDDIQGGQRHYGDNDENNDTAATRTDLGTATNGYTRTNLSLDRQTDVDWYRIAVPSGFSLTVTAAPVGSTYLQGPQGGSTASRNSAAIQNLRLTAYQSNGTTLIAGPQDASGVGAAEVLANVAPVAGVVYIKVDTGTTTNDIQIYQLTLNLTVVGPTLANVTLGTSTATGGDVVQGTVTLTQAAPAGGLVISLSSSDTNTATVPASVTVLEAATAANFDVTTLNVASPTNVTITAQHSSTVRTANLLVNPGPIFFGPTTLAVAPGVIVSGGLADLQSSDDSRLIGRPGPVLISSQAPLVMNMTAFSPMSFPTQLELGIEGFASVSVINRKIEMRNQYTGDFEIVSDTADSTSEILASYVYTTDPQRFINPGDGLVELKITYKATGPVLVYPWQAKLDRVYWKVWQ